MGDDIKLQVVDHLTTTTDAAEPESHERMSPSTSLEDSCTYEPVEPRAHPEPAEDAQGYLIPNPSIPRKGSPSTARKSRKGNDAGFDFFFRLLWSVYTMCNCLCSFVLAGF